MSDTAERLWGVIEPYLAAEGIELDDLEVLGHGAGTIIRVTVDAEEDLGVDRIAETSRGVSRLLDDEDPVTGSYTLEVSSPGLERKLRRSRHYEKSLGREVKVKTKGPIDGSVNHSGELIEADDDGFVVAGESSTTRIAYSDVASARTVFVWEKAAKPGTGH